MNDFLIFTLKEKHVSEPKLTNIVHVLMLWTSWCNTKQIIWKSKLYLLDEYEYHYSLNLGCDEDSTSDNRPNQQHIKIAKMA